MLLTETAIAIVGLVIALHVSPIPLPKVRPFSCGFCTSIWVAAVWFVGQEYTWSEKITGIGLTAFVAGMVVAFAPLLFRSEISDAVPPALPEHSDVRDPY